MGESRTFIQCSGLLDRLPSHSGKDLVLVAYSRFESLCSTSKFALEPSQLSGKSLPHTCLEACVTFT